MRRTCHVVIIASLFSQATMVGLIAPSRTFDELMSTSELNTDFKVLASLKGTPLRAIIVLRHDRQDEERLPDPILDAPLGLDVRPWADDGVPLVLERESYDVCAPTSGHVFPEFAIFALPTGPLTMFPR
jgi:hypothetical protein